MRSRRQLSLSDSCAVCGDPSNSFRYGASACLACIVFFRRVASKGKVRKCEDKMRCVVNSESKNRCQSCRFQKCLKAGMDSGAIQQRDKLGPRNHKTLFSQPENPQNILDHLMNIQRKQRIQHHRYGSYYGSCDGLRINQKLYKRATSNDIGLILHLGFQNAIEWIHEFYQNPIETNSIISEFGIGFILIDQTFKTLFEGEEGFWFFQNDTFLHLDYFLKCPLEEMRRENVEEQAKIHQEFIDNLLNMLITPFRSLKVDKFECVILKTLLLLTVSDPSTNSKQKQKVLLELMKYSTNKFPENGPERFGEMILLIGSIRCAIKMFYNFTKLLDLFDVNNFSFSVRNKLFS